MRERRTKGQSRRRYVAADLDGHAWTLCASYRRSSAYNAELVPVAGDARAPAAILPRAKRRG